MPRIKKLTVNNFRGIREASLDLDGCSLVILGENGTGKSSFVDALEFYFTGTVSHLEGAQGISTNRHAPHIHSSREHTSIILEFDRPAGPVTRTFYSLSGIPEELSDYHNLGANAKFILRRKNLLDFILAQPGPRYEQLAAIIGVSDLDKVERAFMVARDDLEGQVNIINSQVRSEERKLDELIGTTDYSDNQILSALNRKLQELQQLPLQNLEYAESRKLAAVTGSRSPEDTKKAVSIQNSITLLKTLQDNLRLFTSHRALWEAVKDLQANAAQVRELLFREALVASQKLLQEYVDMDLCPVCLQPVDRQILLDSLEKRVLQAQSIEEKSSTIKSLRDELISAIQLLLPQIDQLATQILELKLPWNSAVIGSYQNTLSSLLTDIQREPVEIILPDLDDLGMNPTIISAEEFLQGLATNLAVEKSLLEPTDQDKLTVSVIDLITRVMDSRKALRDFQPKLNTKTAAYREMATIYDCFVSTKRAVVKKIYQDLEGDIKRYFKELHENEGYREIRLDVDEGKRASTEIKMDFHDRQEEDPRAFNSEGHLDSLGLCVFLAFVKRFNLGFPIIALDDVVSSIDAGHRQRICKLLFDEFPDAQLLITTHDYIWFEELRSHQRACGKEQAFKNVQIIGWTLEDGPRLDKYKPRWDRIQNKLDNGDKDGAAGDVRKELEAFLLEATISLRTPIPLTRDGKYTVADLHDPFAARIKKMVPETYQVNLTIFQNLLSNGIFGNLLVHNNPRAENASLEEVRGFADAVKNFENLFTCPQCRQVVTYYRDAKIMRCRCREGGILWVTKE